MHKIQTIFVVLMLCLAVNSQAQDKEKVFQTFHDTRIINSHSIETLPGGKLDFRVSHRFGDLAGDAGGWQTFYGLENAADVGIGFEYGLNDNTMIGISRTKGSGPLKQNVNGLIKLKIVNQEINGNQPLTITLLGMTSYSTMQKSKTEGVLHFFTKDIHRFSYHMALHMGHKFSERLALQVNGGWTYRNIVPSDDKNDLVSVGAAARIQLTRAMGLIVDATFPISELRTKANNYYPSFGIGFEFDTSGGHVFQINLTNATGLVETDYIPYTRTDWGQGEFRLGFTISRLFTL